MELSKKYNPAEFEKDIYETWMQKGYFRAERSKTKEAFSIVMPPPNITGQLHMGHALDNSIQDVIVRFKRMQGYSTLWLPGTDHASIATEVKIVERLKEQGITKADLSREAFLEHAWKWKEEFGGRIVQQMKTLGLSCDWSREAFTMDEKCSKAVLKVFIGLYNKGLIYKGNRIINWCPSCHTALSDAEVEYEEHQSYIWHVRYPFADGSGEIIIATTRPETIPGDTAVAVNPKDERYKNLIGKMLTLPLCGREIPLIADEYVEMDFGSGAVKITPAHDPNDFEVGLRHNLEVIKIMNDSAVLNEKSGAYNGLSREEARKKIVADLKAETYLVKEEKYNHNVGQCYRCKTVVEPIVSKQWFVKMDTLAKPAIKVVKNKRIKFKPDRFSKTYFNWMENIKDWCISRQLWWGHRIPAYYCENCGEMVVSDTMPKNCSKCSCTNFKQDEDVLDTWFSSALWPFSTLGYPDKTEDLKYFYPTSLLVTGYDIIFFWVARMIFSGLEHMGDIPFEDVLIHGIVRDSQGRKMSKSLGNGVDPLPIIEKYGADSLRFSLITGVAPGNDTRFSEEKVESAAGFMNKLWNAARFIMMNKKTKKIPELKNLRFSYADKWILSSLNDTIRDVTKNINNFELGTALQTIYSFIWGEFCDKYLELIKVDLRSDNKKRQEKAIAVSSHVFLTSLKLLHPFLPFITEKLYTAILETKNTIMLEKWPSVNRGYSYRKEKTAFEKVLDLNKEIRHLRAESNIPASKRIDLLLSTQNEENIKILNNNVEYIEVLVKANSIDISSEDKTSNNDIVGTTLLADIAIKANEVNLEEEIAKLEIEKEFAQGQITRSSGLLNNPGFVAKAPQQLIEKETNTLNTYKSKLVEIEIKLDKMKQILQN